MKKIIVGMMLGIVISVGGSVFALQSKTTTVKPSVSHTIPLIEAPMTPQEQVQVGNVYDIYTGQKLITQPVLSDTEIRFRSIEARLTALEAKVK